MRFGANIRDEDDTVGLLLKRPGDCHGANREEYESLGIKIQHNTTLDKELKQPRHHHTNHNPTVSWGKAVPSETSRNVNMQKRNENVKPTVS